MDPEQELTALKALVQDHDRWLWAAKGACALALLFMGLIVYVFSDVRQELRTKISVEAGEERMVRMERRLDYIDARLERLRDMMPDPSERGGPH